MNDTNDNPAPRPVSASDTDLELMLRRESAGLRPVLSALRWVGFLLALWGGYYILSYSKERTREYQQHSMDSQSRVARTSNIPARTSSSFERQKAESPSLSERLMSLFRSPKSDPNSYSNFGKSNRELQAEWKAQGQFLPSVPGDIFQQGSQFANEAMRDAVSTADKLPAAAAKQLNQEFNIRALTNDTKPSRRRAR